MCVELILKISTWLFKGDRHFKFCHQFGSISTAMQIYFTVMITGNNMVGEPMKVIVLLTNGNNT